MRAPGEMRAPGDLRVERTVEILTAVWQLDAILGQLVELRGQYRRVTPPYVICAEIVCRVRGWELFRGWG